MLRRRDWTRNVEKLCTLPALSASLSCCSRASCRQTVASIFPSSARDFAGRDCPPVELKVLGTLKVLASGCCFQDVASFSLMSRTTAETSFHHFCENFSEGLWDTWVKLPRGDELKKVEEIYRKCGYPGATGSTDCTHFRWPGCPFSEENTHTGK
ncbi:unnamed protein product [Ectocarpus sp. CCAP 1310/34]|nr:unnamed protein product [Ectocarpus sp. CCAP 1310/34]